MTADHEWVDLDEVADIVHLATLNGNGTEPDQPENSWRPQNLNDLPEQPPTPPNLGNTHLVYPGKRHVFSGPPESAKTLAAYCILIQVVRNGGSGILIDFEMGAYDARQRLRELGATADEINSIHYVEPDERATTEHVANLIHLQPDLVIIDAAAGIYSLEGLDDNKRGDVEKISNLYIRAFWRNGIATILLDHVVKDGEARGKFAIGSERKLGGADVHMGFDTISPISRGSSGKYKISTHKDRGGYLKRGHLADLQLDSDPDTHNITWTFTEAVITTDDMGHFRPTIKMEQVSKALTGELEPLSKAEVKRRVGGNGQKCGDAIDVLIHEGHLTASDGPRGSVLVTLTRPYLRENDPLENPVDNPENPPVPDLFSSCSRTGDPVTCSAVPSPTGEEQLAQPSHQLGWMDENGTFYGTGHDAYIDSLEPDADDDIEVPT